MHHMTLALLMAGPQPVLPPSGPSLPVDVTPVDCPATAEQVPGIDPTDARVSARHLVVVRKGVRRVQLFKNGVAAPGTGSHGYACYRAGLGFAPEGHKQREGDGRTPEGWYTTSDKPWSSFHAAIAVHYPSAQDARTAASEGRITPATRDRIAAAQRTGKKPPQTTAMGGEILLHGGGSSSDWTLGCIALEDADIDDLRSRLPPGMTVQVRILP